jgi:hypothetical protein
MVNNSANYRDNCFEARELVEADKLGEIHHVMCCMYSPLMGLFDDPANVDPAYPHPSPSPTPTWPQPQP